MEGKAAHVVDAEHVPRRALVDQALQVGRAVHRLAVDAGKDVVMTKVRRVHRIRRPDVGYAHSHTVGILPAGEGGSGQSGEDQQEHQDAYLF